VTETLEWRGLIVWLDSGSAPTHTHTFPPDYSARWAKNKVHELASHMPQCCVLMTSTEFLAWRYNGFAKNRAAAPPSGTEPKHTANMSYIYDHHRWGIYFFTHRPIWQQHF